MQIDGFDHIVLCVKDVGKTVAFYQGILGMEAREERAGKWSLHFGPSKISLQTPASAPPMAKNTIPGSGNFCVVTQTPIEDVAAHLRAHEIEILEGPAEKIGAVGKLMSVYFRDPDDNLVEISNRLG
jgi:catechol 2,3-dioxygenase-like lactoylglutathione lyase family enzyme